MIIVRIMKLWNGLFSMKISRGYVSAEICMLHAIQNPASSKVKNETDELTGGLPDIERAMERIAGADGWCWRGDDGCGRCNPGERLSGRSRLPRGCERQPDRLAPTALVSRRQYAVPTGARPLTLNWRAVESGS
jgi:hypothetical protein